MAPSTPSPSVTDVILHCQRQIKKELPSDKLMHYLRRLKRLRLKVKDLIDTGIGRTVNQLARNEGQVGQFAEELVAEWKALVEAEKSTEESSSERQSSSGEEEEEESVHNQQDHHNHPVSEEEDDDEPSGLVINEQVTDHNSSGSSSSSSAEEEEPVHAKVKVHVSSVKVEPNTETESESEEELKERVLLSVPARHSRSRSRDRQTMKEEPRSSGSEEEESQQSMSKLSSKHRLSRSPVPNEVKTKVKQEPCNGSGSSSVSVRKKTLPEVVVVPDKVTVKVKVEKVDPPKEVHGKREKNGDKSNIKKLVTIKSEIDSTCGLNFADVIGCSDFVKPKGQKVNGVVGGSKQSPSPSKSKSPSKDKDRDRTDSGPLGTVDHHRSSKQRVSHVKLETPDPEVRSVPRSSTSKSGSRSRSAVNPKVEEHKSSKIALSQIISPHYKPNPVSHSRVVSSSLSVGLHGNGKKKAVVDMDILNGLELDDEPTVKHVSSSVSQKIQWTPSTDAHALATMISSRNQRTKVYSGVKTGYFGTVPSLFDMCLRVIQENLDDLGYTGGVPFDILKPVLQRATVPQLLQIENFNPYLIESTAELWQFHCKRDFRGRAREECETWREVYTRCVDEREKKFLSAKRKVERNIEVKPAERKAKLAYVETTAGPKFSKSKAATIKNGMKSLKTREEKVGLKRTHDQITASSSAASSNGSHTKNTNVNHHVMKIEEAAVIIPSSSKAGSAPAPSVSRERDYSSASGPPNKKLKKAPLMQKTLKIIKSLRR